MLIRPFIAFEPDDPGGATPAATEPVTPEPVQPAEPGPGPWAQDIAEYFTDEASRAAADRYHREKIQPHVTELEQHPSRQLYADLIEDAPQTLGYLVEELYDEEAAKEFAEWLAAREATPPSEPAPPADPAASPQRSPEDEELLEWARGKREEDTQQQAAGAYAAALARVKQQPGGETIVDELFAPFVSIAEGDFDQALAAWNQYGGAVKEKFGVTEPTPPPAPTVLGGNAPGGGVPPVAKRYTSFEEAFDDTMDEVRAKRDAPNVIS